MTNLIYQEQIVPSKVVFLINSGLVKFLSDRKHSKWFKLWRSGLNSLILLLSFYVTLGKMLYFFKPRSPMWKRRITALSQFMPVLWIRQSVDWLRDVYAHLWEGTYKNTLKRLQIHEWDPTKLGICITFGRHTGGIHSPRVSPQGLGNPPTSLPLFLPNSCYVIGKVPSLQPSRGWLYAGLCSSSWVYFSQMPADGSAGWVMTEICPWKPAKSFGKAIIDFFFCFQLIDWKCLKLTSESRLIFPMLLCRETKWILSEPWRQIEE